MLGALGVFLAAVMAGTAVTVAVALQTGFDRAADRADLPDAIVRFDRHDAADALRRARALPGVERAAVRLSFDHLPLAANGHGSKNGTVSLVEPGRRGYAILAGRDLADGAGREVVVERGVARAWGVGPGDRLTADDLPFRIVGVSVTPDNVAFPLAAVPKVYESEPGLRRRYRVSGPGIATEVLLWVHDRGRLDVTLAQARATSAGLTNLRLITRSGVRVLVNGAAGIVVALLAAFSLVALASAAVMLAASAQGEVRRRLPALGVLRAAGATRRRLAGREALAAARLAALPAALGIAAGWLAAIGPIGGLLAALNQLAPGAALLPWLAAAFAGIVAIVAAASAWPAWRATRGPVAGLLRGADLVRSAPADSAPARPLLLGVRAMAARRVRLGLSAAVVASAAAVVLLMLALASLLVALRDDPGTLGRRYQLTARLPAERRADVARIPGVAAVQPRYVLDAVDSFRLGETLRLVAYPGDHTRFEAPALAAGRRLGAAGEAEVGVGLADALGLRPGSTLAAQLPGGREVRFRVSGVVRALDSDGRIAYVRPRRLLDADPGLTPTLAIRLTAPQARAKVVRALEELGAQPRPVGAATTRSGAFLGTLGTVLRVVAAVNGLVCLYALLAALALVAGERRGLVALLRAVGARRRDVLAVFAGAAGLLVLLAAPVALATELLALGPLVGRLAADYAVLGLAPSAAQTLVAGAALALAASIAALLTARRALSTPVVDGLAEVEG